MGKRVIRRRTIRQRHLVHEARDVVLVIVEALDVAFERIPHEPARAALPAPIEHRHGKAPAPELAHHLEIFFDELAAPGKDADRAMPLLERRAPARKAQAHAALALQNPTETPSGIGFFGVATRSMTLKLPFFSLLANLFSCYESCDYALLTV